MMAMRDGTATERWTAERCKREGVCSSPEPDRIQGHSGFSRTEVNQPPVGCNPNAAGRVALGRAARTTRRLSGFPRERGATARCPFLLFRSQPG
jgi:hypothetical protein